MKKYKFKTHCNHYYYGGYHDMEITVFGNCTYFIPSIHEEPSTQNGIFRSDEHVFLIIKK